MEISLKIDGKTVSAAKGESLIDVARRNGAEIPSLCHHPLIAAYGACRLCLVEVNKNGKKQLTTSCNYEVHEDIEVTTDTEAIRAHRKFVLELLLGLAPEAKNIRGLARTYGVAEPLFELKKESASRPNCILCGLCSRVCSDVVGAAAISLCGRGDRRELEVPFKERIADSCIGCGACAAVCPTGAIEMESIKVEAERERPASKRSCRYAMMGLMSGALCPNNYDCARCEIDQRFIEASAPHHPVFAARGLTPLNGFEEE